MSRAKASKNRIRKSSADEEIRRQAFLYSIYLREGDFTQSQIAERIGITDQELSRNLRTARERGWLTEVFVRPSSMDETEWATCQKHVKNFERAQRLKEDFSSFRYPPNRIHVVECGPKNLKPDQRRRVFSASAGPIVLSILQDSQTKSLAVAWGRMMKSLCFDGIGPFCAVKHPRRHEPIDIFPVRGEPFRASIDVSPTTIALALGRFLNGDTTKVRSLAGLQAVIPGPLVHQDVEAVHRMLREVPVFKEVFGASGLADKMTTMLASFGPAEWDSDWTQECLSIGGFKEITNLMVGDLAGVPVPKDDDKETANKIEAKAKRLIGVTRKQIQDCVWRAREPGSRHQGVILVGMGPERSRCLRRICELGWASILVIDTDLADALVTPSRRHPH